VGFVVDKVALGQVFSEHFGFPCQFSFYRLLHAHHLPSGAGTIGQLVADVPGGLSVTAHPKKLKKKKKNLWICGSFAPTVDSRRGILVTIHVRYKKIENI
jgi:hypothetical protein